MRKPSILQKVLTHSITRMFAGLIIIGFVLYAVQLPFKSWFASIVSQTESVDFLIEVTTAVTALIAYVILYRWYERRPITELSFHKAWRYILIGLITGFGLQTLVILVLYIAGGYTVSGVHPIGFVIPSLGIAIGSAFVEEIIFRGIVFRLMEEQLGSILSLIVSALLFGIMHLGNKGATLYSAVSIALQAGILLAAGYILTRSLWLPISLHFAWNFAESGIFGALLSGNDIGKSLLSAKLSGNDLFSGGVFGPENSIQANIFCLSAGAVFLVYAYKKKRFISPIWKRNSS